MLLNLVNINILYDINIICHNFHIVLNIYYQNMAYNNNVFFQGSLVSTVILQVISFPALVVSKNLGLFYFLPPTPLINNILRN